MQERRPHSPDNPTRALRAILANPYAQATSSSYSPHHAQLYEASSSRWPTKNAQGYTLSSTYRPSQGDTQRKDSQWNQIGMTISRTSQVTKPFKRQSLPGQWYQAGNIRCTYKGCMFMGSQKSVEVHRMDRHLIYPPGWDPRKRRDEWDADPSLKGKAVPIQGTNITLNSPEVLEEWLAERKKRWPSSSRVEEQKRKLEEALARGQIPFHETSHLGKRKSRDFETIPARHYSPMNLNFTQRRNGSGGVLSQRTGRRIANTRTEKILISQFQSPTPSRYTGPLPQNVGAGSSLSDEDGPPEIVSSKAPSVGMEQFQTSEVADAQVTSPQDCSKDGPGNRGTKPSKKMHPPQPKGPRSPSASRPSLLRNLLLPEIRITVSNLSQAIRFLVDNDFLDGVELKPGEADRDKLIQVIEPAP